MFYNNIEKLNELEKTLSQNLMKADGHTWKDSHKPHWLNYRNDIPNCLHVIREYRKLLETLQNDLSLNQIEKLKKETK